MKLKSLQALLIGGSLLGCAGTAGAAPITWVDTGNFSSENDINMTGTVVRAGHMARSNQAYTNTVSVANAYGIIDFEPMGADSYANDITNPNASVGGTIGGIYGAGVIYQQGGSADFNDAMDTVCYNSGVPGQQEMELVLSNLTIGVTYQVQLFTSAENNDKGTHNYMYYSDSATPFSGNYTSTNTLLAIAAYGTGQFTADATTQSIWTHRSGLRDDGTEAQLGATFNAYVLMKEPFVLPPRLPQPGDTLLPFSISTNSVLNGVEDVITFPTQLYKTYTLWGSSDLTDWVAVTPTNGIIGLHQTEVSVTNVQSSSPYFYKVTGQNQ